MKNTISTLIAIFLVMGFVAAAGSSTGSYKPPAQTPPPTTTDTSKASSNPATGGLAVRPCEERTTVKERVQCRLEQGKPAATGQEESCRGLADGKACTDLYAKSEKCYEVTGVEKDRCFKQSIGFSDSVVRNEASKNAGNVRQYVVLLLYDLQERVEAQYKAGKITSDQASQLVTDIVAAKQTILQGKSKVDVKASIAVVKQDWKKVMPQ